MKKDKKISYIKSNGKYLIFKENGKTETINSKEEFDKHIELNNYSIKNN